MMLNFPVRCTGYQLILFKTCAQTYINFMEITLYTLNKPLRTLKPKTKNQVPLILFLSLSNLVSRCQKSYNSIGIN